VYALRDDTIYFIFIFIFSSLSLFLTVIGGCGNWRQNQAAARRNRQAANDWIARARGLATALHVCS
jgi:hypothetical protein